MPRRAKRNRAEQRRTQPSLGRSAAEAPALGGAVPAAGAARGRAGPGRRSLLPDPPLLPLRSLPFPPVRSPPPCAARTWRRRRRRRGTEQRQRSAAAQVRGGPGRAARMGSVRPGAERRGGARARSPAWVSSLLSARPGRRLSAVPGPGAAVTARTCWCPSGTGPPGSGQRPGGSSAPRLPGRAVPPGEASCRALLLCRVSPGRASGSRGAASPRDLGAVLGPAGAAPFPGGARCQPGAPGCTGTAGLSCRGFAGGGHGCGLCPGGFMPFLPHEPFGAR